MAAVVEAAEIAVGDCVVIQGLGALGLWGVRLPGARSEYDGLAPPAGGRAAPRVPA